MNSTGPFTKFNASAPCLRIQIETKAPPRKFYEKEDHAPARITVHRASHPAFMLLLVRFIVHRLKTNGIKHGVSGKSMDFEDIQITLTDPAEYPAHVDLFSHSLPIQIVILGSKDMMRWLEADILDFMTKQQLRKQYADVADNHWCLHSVSPLWCPL